MAVTISDLSLREITLDSLPRLKRLRELHFNTRPEICLVHQSFGQERCINIFWKIKAHLFLMKISL